MSILLPLSMLSPGEILVVILIILVIFGASRLPKFVGSLRKSAKEFKKGLKEGDGEKEPASKEKVEKD